MTAQCLLQMRYFNFNQLGWLRILAVLSGLPGSSFSKIGIRDEKMAKKLLIVSSNMLFFVYQLVIGTTTLNFLLFVLMCYVANFSLFDYMLHGLPFQVMNLIWAFVLTIVAGSFIATFVITSFYLKIRFKQVNLVLSKLNKLSNIGEIVVEYDQKISLKLDELNRVCILTDEYNKFFSILIFGGLLSLVPTTTFYLYQLIYEKTDLLLIKSLFCFLLITFIFILIITTLTASLIDSEARRLYPVLNSLICSNCINLQVRLKVINLRLKSL
jgi:hypothetical protein